MENTPNYNQSAEYKLLSTSNDYTQDIGYDNLQLQSYTQQQDPNKEVMSMKEWFLTYLILLIPIINIIMLFIWAFGDSNENLKNYCRVQLIFMLIGIVLTILFGSLMFGVVYSIMKKTNSMSTLISFSRLFI